MHQKSVDEQMSPFRIMNTMFIGLALSLTYGIVSAAAVLVFDGKPEFQLFVAAYTTAFRTVISLGLILGTALFVLQSQSVISTTVESAFAPADLAATKYGFYKRRFDSRRRSMTFAAEFGVVGFVVFSTCHFPLTRASEVFMMVAACTEYALGVYIGRKLCYGGMMLHSLLRADVRRNLFKARELDDIDTYVHVASTLTIIFVYLHVAGYYDGPFKYDGVLGRSIKPMLVLPAVIATPVLLIFNFYPRAVLRRIYGQSIDVEVAKLKKNLQNESLSPFEKKSYVIEFDKMSRDELRNSLRLTLTDLPIGITILVMIVESLLKK